MDIRIQTLIMKFGANCAYDREAALLFFDYAILSVIGYNAVVKYYNSID